MPIHVSVLHPIVIWAAGTTFNCGVNCGQVVRFRLVNVDALKNCGQVVRFRLLNVDALKKLGCGNITNGTQSTQKSFAFSTFHGWKKQDCQNLTDGRHTETFCFLEVGYVKISRRAGGTHRNLLLSRTQIQQYFCKHMYFVQAIELYAVWRKKIVQLNGGRTDGPDCTRIQIST